MPGSSQITARRLTRAYAEQRTRDALISLQQLLQAKCAEPDPAMEDQVGTLKTNINNLESTAIAFVAMILQASIQQL